MFSSKDLFFTPAASGTYTVSKSLRFRSSATAYLSRTPGSAGNRRTFTFSAWVKRGALGTRQALFSAGAVSTTPSGAIYFTTTTDTLSIIGGGGAQYQLVTTQVFRDVSAWYHVVITFDTTQATASNRIKLYVNGSQVTAFSTSTYPSLNFDTDYGNSVLTAIGSRTDDGTPPVSTFDGYLAEVNYINGSALDPTSFGAYDTNGVWQPARYAGSYGTNGFYLPFTLNSTSTYAGSFNGTSKYLTTPTSSNLAFGTGDFTIEGWFNQTTLNNSGLVCQDYATGVDIRFNEGASNVFGFYINNSSFVSGSYTNAQTAQWHHFALVRSGSGSNNVKLYLDGVVLCQTTSTANLTSNQFRIGANLTGGTTPAGTYFSGSISNVRVVKGTAVYTAPFTPPTSALTAITNTQLLTLQDATIVDNSSNAFTLTNTGTVATASATPFVANITSDASGNNNGWTSNNINYTSSGTTYDSMLDSPTNAAGDIGNYAVANPLSVNSATLTDGNLSVSVSGVASAVATAAGTVGVSSGKWYWETTVVSNTTSDLMIGIVDITRAATARNYSNANTWYYYGANGNKYISGTGSSYGASYTNNDVIGIALDMDSGTIAFYKNGTSQGTAASTGISGLTIVPVWGNATSGGAQVYAANFGQRPFAYTAPSGYSALNTQNLTTPTITNGAQYFAATLWTGNASARAISNGTNNTIGTTFQSDFVWVKSRTQAIAHRLVDVVRGATLTLSSNLTNAEYTDSQGVTAFNATGFNIGTDTSYNNTGDTYVGWNWKAGGTGVSNTSGSITSTVSANTTAGFSVVTYTQQSSGTATVGHGLGVAPNMIIVKGRNWASGWYTYHSSVGIGSYLFLNTTAAATADTGGSIFNSTSPTSSVFSLGSGWASGASQTSVVYCFAPVAGYSAFGSYTGNGNSDGVFVYLNMRPRWLLIKRTDTAGYDWFMVDTSRATYNLIGPALNADTSGAEFTLNAGTGGGLDVLSNGFKFRGSAADLNASGGTYIYAAFAENPFKISRAR